MESQPWKLQTSTMHLLHSLAPVMGNIRPYAALPTPRLYVIWRPQSFGQLQGQLPSIFCATMVLIPSQTSLLGILEMWSSLLLQFLSLSLQISPSASWLAPPVSMLQTSPHAHVSKYNLRLILQQGIILNFINLFQ